MAFATASDLAAYMQQSLTAEGTATAELLLDLATAAVQSVVGQTITLTTDDPVTLDAPDGTLLTLPERPALAPTLVEVGGVAVTDWTAEVPYSSLRPTVLYRASGWRAYDSNGALEPVHVTYTHGYATPPEELKRIVLQAAARAYRNPEGLRSETIGGESYTYAIETVPNEVALTKKELRDARRAVGVGGAYTVDVLPAAAPGPWGWLA